MIHKILKSYSWLFLGVLFFVMSSAGVVLADLVKGRPLSLQQVQELFDTSSTSEFPFEANELVIKELNHYLRTSQSRAALKGAFERLRNSEAQKVFDESGLPAELLVIPVIESMYENVKAPGTGEGPGGVWQFTAETARNFGLKMSGEVDQRQDVDKQTEAAARLFQYYKKSYDSWPLAVLAYNVGEGRLEQRIKRLDTKDPWILSKSFQRRANKTYLAKVMALVVIQKNPRLLE